MKTKASAQTWDDLVFENRHKDYGAYAVRQHYSQNMTAGLGVSVSIACLLVMLPKILAMLGVNDEIICALPKPPDLSTVIDIGPPPNIELPPVAPPPAAAAAVQPMNNNVVPTVTSAPVDTPVIPNDQIVTSSSAPGTGDGPPVDVPSTGTGIVESVGPAVSPSNEIFIGAEVMPEYDGGLQALAKFIQRKVRTPRSVTSQHISGTVFVQFVVRSDGSITDVNVVRGIAADCDREAIRLVSLMTGWKAGMQNHQPVSVRMVLPIKFQAQEL